MKDDSEWGNTVENILVDVSIGIHLAVFNEPFLSLVFSGEKKIESRFSINKISPYERVKEGDVVILKESGGPITGIFIVGEVKFFKHLDKYLITKIENEFGELICTSYDENFWIKREKANYASLIEVSKIKKLPPSKVKKEIEAVGQFLE